MARVQHQHRTFTVRQNAKKIKKHNVVEIFAATCSGTAFLSRKIGLPVAYIGVASDAETAVLGMRQQHYASGTLWLRSFQPIKPEKGWDDWNLFHFDEGGSGPAPYCGATFWNGRIRIPLPDAMQISEFRSHLTAAIAHLRFDAVTRSPHWLEARNSDLRDLVVHSRYTFNMNNDYRSGVALVTDLYVIDPSGADGLRLLWLAVGAKLAASSEAIAPLWR